MSHPRLLPLALVLTTACSVGSYSAPEDAAVPGAAAPGADTDGDSSQAGPFDALLDTLGLGGEPEPEPPTLAITLTDAPGDFQAVPVQIDRVDVCHIAAEDEAADTGAPDADTGAAEEDADTGAPEAELREEETEEPCTWSTIADEPAEWDLLLLQDGVTALLGSQALAPGHYSQVRLIVSSAAVVVDDVTHELDVPSGEQTGLKLHHDFKIADTGAHELRLDWDAHESIRQRGNGSYFLTPVITVDYFGPATEAADESASETEPETEPEVGDSGAAG